MTKEEFIQVRKELGLTQTGIGVEIGRSLRQVQYYEAGELPVPPEIARLIRFLLNDKKKKR